MEIDIVIAIKSGIVQECEAYKHTEDAIYRQQELKKEYTDEDTESVELIRDVEIFENFLEIPGRGD